MKATQVFPCHKICCCLSKQPPKCIINITISILTKSLPFSYPPFDNIMFVHKQKTKPLPPKPSHSSEEYNEFLDDFLKPPQKAQDSSSRFRGKEHTIKMQHHSVPSKLPKNNLDRVQSQANRQIKEILRNIKKQEELRKEKTRLILQKLAQEKEEEKKMHEFRIAERRIRKRMMLLERRDRLQEELLSFVHQRQEDPTPTRNRKEKAKSVDDLASHPLSEGKTKIITPQQLRRSKCDKNVPMDQSHTSVVKEKIHLSSQVILPQIQNTSDNRQNRVSTITLTRQLRLEQDPPRPKHKDYLQELRQGKRRHYTESNSQLQRIYERDLSKQRSRTEKAERAVQLTTKLQNKRRLRLKNLNDVDFRLAERKLQLLNFLHRAQE